MSSNLPWSLRRHLPCYPHNYHQTSFDHDLANSDPAITAQMLSQGSVRYDHANLKGDGTANLVWVRGLPRRIGWGSTARGSGGSRPGVGSKGPAPYPNPGRPPSWRSGRGSHHGRPPRSYRTPSPTVSASCPPPGSRHSRASTRSSHHPPRGSRAPSGNRHSRPPVSYCTPSPPVSGSGPPPRSRHSRPPSRSSHHTNPSSLHSLSPPSHAGSPAPSRGRLSCPTARSSHRTEAVSRRSSPGPARSVGAGGGSRHSCAGSGMGSRHSRAGPGMGSRGSGLGSVKVNSRGMTWRDV